jgi:phosphomevalonate kinase
MKKKLGVKQRIAILDRMDAFKRIREASDAQKAMLRRQSTMDEIQRLRGAMNHGVPTNGAAVAAHLAQLQEQLKHMKHYK